MSPTALVLAPHPDDEVLGPGGTVARLVSEGATAHVVVVTRGQPPLFTSEQVQRTRSEADRAHEVLGVASAEFLDFPAAALDVTPHAELNRAIEDTLVRLQPELLFVPFNGDMHRDHREVFDSAMVAARPGGPATPKAIYAYETLSETNWNAPYLTADFVPTVFFDISEHIERKIAALSCYESQLRPSPHERSLDAVRALATLRGSTVAKKAAEGFIMIRELR